MFSLPFVCLLPGLRKSSWTESFRETWWKGGGAGGGWAKEELINVWSGFDSEGGSRNVFYTFLNMVRNACSLGGGMHTLSYLLVFHTLCLYRMWLALCSLISIVYCTSGGLKIMTILSIINYYITVIINLQLLFCLIHHLAAKMS